MRSQPGVGLMLAALALAACGRARSVGEAAAVGPCTPCHGGEDNASGAPPRDLHGRSDTALPSVGAHSTHIGAGIDCGACHPKPSSVSSPGHMDGRVDLAFGPVATANGTLSPRFDEATGACTNVYCHGGFAGGIPNAPSWIRVGQGGGACGTCHPIPPSANGHPQTTACGNCHAGYSSTSVNRATHANGKVDVLPMSCTSCHGDPARPATALNPQLGAAPPVDTSGDSSPGAHGVGAHQAHLLDGPLRTALPCIECHVVPASLTGHPTGALVLAFGTLASTGGAAPYYSGGSCASTYCHGATLGAGGTNHAPAWTGGAAEASCGACHDLPPPSPHPQNASCGHCHPGYALDSVNPATHVNGQPDVVGLTCTTCHGDPQRAATALNPQLAAAPPTDTTGSSDPSSHGVGAHAAHLSDGPLRGALACVDCHDVPTTTSHATGTTTFHWSALATAGGAIAPAYSGGSCSATYCHGATLAAGGTNHSPAWAGGAPEAACGTCHAAPPPAPHPPNSSCGHCHDGYSATSVNLARHVNGTVDVLPMTCTSCHGDPNRLATALNPQLPAAPPTDTHGDAVSSHVGAHQTHLNGSALSSPLACTQCHAVPPDLAAHPTGVLDLTWGSLATGAITATLSTDPSFAGFSTTSPSYAGGSCSATYCHGAYSGTFTYTIPGSDPPEQNTISYAGSAATPSWAGTAACGTCHGIPPTGTGGWHSGVHGGGNDCSLCHPDASGTSAADAAVTDPSLHMDGKVDLAPHFVSSCFHCH